MKEKIIKEKLIKLLSNDFEIIEKISGLNFYGKEIRPDFAFKFKDSNGFFVVEIKDDTTKNFDLTELLRQAITYKHSVYNGLIPNYCFVTTYEMLKGNFNTSKSAEMFGLSYKLGIGRIYLTDGNKIQIGVGSQIYYKYDIQSGDSEFNFQNLSSITVGTNAKSNRVENKL